MQNKISEMLPTPIRMAIINTATNNKCWQGCREKGILIHHWWQCKLCRHYEKQYGDFSKNSKWNYHVCMRAKLLQSCPTLCNPVYCSLPGSSVYGILRQEYWSGLSCPPPGDRPNPGSLCLLCFLHWQGGSLPLVPPVKPLEPSNSIPGYLSGKKKKTNTNWKRYMHLNSSIYNSIICCCQNMKVAKICSCRDISPVGKESACNAGDPSSIPGLERSAGKEIGYPLQYSWVSLVAQLVKNLPAMQETWIRPLG